MKKKKRFLSLFSIPLIFWVIVAEATEKSEIGQPNVIFILSDDQSWNDYGFMGHPHLVTPNLDQLAGEGFLYERGYTTAAICRPSLASIVTGLYPHQTGVRGNRPFMGEGIDHRQLRRNKKLWPLAQEQSKAMTATLANAPSMVRQLQDNGYATIQTGKWWEGDPLDHGFDEGCGHQIGRKTMEPIYNFVDKAQKNSQPFFIWYAVFLPHTPHNAPDRHYLKYKDQAPNESTARYWANIAWLDETCGQLVDFLKEKNLYDNTLFVFTADNGWRPDPNQVSWYVRSKKEPVEAGVRTPIFLTHKNKISPGRDKKTLASNIDIAPTILKACGIEPDTAMSGLDLRKPQALAERDRIFVDVYWDNIRVDALEDLDSDLIARVVIDGWDKLIVRPDRQELYDLKNDPDDRTDLTAQHPEKVKKLSGVIDDWLEETPMIFPDTGIRNNKAAFEKAAARTSWVEVFSDGCTQDWKAKWFLDGEVGTVTNSKEGMTLTAGPEFKNDAHHMVLWTKDTFEGDLKIEYEYSRLDEATNCVNILYIQATGSGESPYAKDITKWSELRKVPAMKTYYNHMNTYHISYAAHPGTKKAYIRGRRYMPEKQGLSGTELKLDYSTPKLFATGVKHHITVIKQDRYLYMRVENPDQVAYFHMINPDLPVISEGRIGLRHMFTRSARYANFRVSVPQ